MKVLDIRLKNLNSLKGEWHIDLTGNSFADGIFAITGPTGAGKTTIFDAVCLALYGMTPRLGKISGRNNEIMSRGTSECYAQVIFETDNGRFTARWSQTRSSKRSKGKLQTYNHKLDAEEKPLTSGIKETADKIVELTGMNFKQFSQAMMLQQGGFDAFLNADKNERAQVLESVTGIEIYGEISQRVFQRSKDEARALKEIESKLEDKQKYILDSDKLNSELNENIARINKLETEHKDIKAAKDWLSDIAKLENDLEQNKFKIKAQQKRLDEFKLKREKLERAESAASIEANYTELKSERSAFKKSQELGEKILNDINTCKKKLFDINGKKLPELKKSLRDEMRDLDLQENPDVIKAKIFAAISKFDNAYKDKQRLDGECKDTELKLNQARADLQKFLNARDSARIEMDKALSESSKISDEIIKFRTRTAEAVLAEERIKLKAGEPCPLCGSLEHPAARHVKTSSDKAAELFKTTEMLEKNFKQAQRKYEEAKNKFDELDKKYNAVSDSERTLSGALEKIKSDMQGKSDELDACHAEVSEAIKFLGLTGNDRKNTTQIRKCVEEWALRVNKIKNDIADAELALNRFNAELDNLNKNLDAENKNFAGLSEKVKELEAKFQAALLDKDFADEKSFAAALANFKTDDTAELQTERGKLDDGMKSLLAVQENKSLELDKIKAKSITNKSLELVEREFNGQETELKDLNARIAVIKKSLQDNADRQGEIANLRKDFERQKEISGGWAGLNSLIGSAKGDLFRIFAQKITLRLMLGSANEYLKRMNGRYTLMLTPGNDDLKLSVIDHEQAGEIRPTENLSGGEKFIVSLALALGLSQISGSKTRVDSLFLDEGFGSLDEEALNTALEALGEVRREGRMIGIISHVQALKERIAAQIEVIPRTEGVSVLQGPGCERK